MIADLIFCSAFYYDLCGRIWTNSIQHPIRKNEPLFLLFDTTHNMKNIYNNWVCRSTFKMPKVNEDLGLLIPSDRVVNFKHIKSVFEKEETSIVKVAHALKENALHPTNIQKVSPKFALCKLKPLINSFSFHFILYFVFLN